MARGIPEESFQLLLCPSLYKWPNNMTSCCSTPNYVFSISACYFTDSIDLSSTRMSTLSWSISVRNIFFSISKCHIWHLSLSVSTAHWHVHIQTIKQAKMHFVVFQEQNTITAYARTHFLELHLSVCAFVCVHVCIFPWFSIWPQRVWQMDMSELDGAPRLLC